MRSSAFAAWLKGSTSLTDSAKLDQRAKRQWGARRSLALARTAVVANNQSVRLSRFFVRMDRFRIADTLIQGISSAKCLPGFLAEKRCVM